MKVWLLFVALPLALLQAAGPEGIPKAPAAPGVYYCRNGSKWIPMKPARIAKTKAKGLETYISSGGYTDFDLKVFYRGKKAHLRILSPMPRFFVRGVGTLKNAILVRLTEQDGERSCQTSPSDATIENKEGFKKEDVVKVAGDKYPDGSFSLTPEKDLKPGEYLLVVGTTAAGYDFGVD